MRQLNVQEAIKGMIAPKRAAVALSNWTEIEKALADRQITDDWNKAAAFATTMIETGSTMMPLKEYGNQAYFKEHYWDNLDCRHALGNIQQSDAWKYCGHGFIQLTGRNNFAKFENTFNLPVLEKPEMLLDPKTAATALAWFWHMHGIDHLCNMVAKESSSVIRYGLWKNVRMRVNGGTNGFDRFMAILNRVGFG